MKRRTLLAALLAPVLAPLGKVLGKGKPGLYNWTFRYEGQSRERVVAKVNKALAEYRSVQPPKITMQDIDDVTKAYFAAVRKTPRILPPSAMKDLMKGTHEDRTQ